MMKKLKMWFYVKAVVFIAIDCLRSVNANKCEEGERREVAEMICNIPVSNMIQVVYDYGIGGKRAARKLADEYNKLLTWANEKGFVIIDN